MSGRPRYLSDEQILDEFRTSDDAFLTAVEIAESFSMTRTGIRRRLEQLEEDGALRSKKAGSRAVGWWLEN
jgi:DNA-binding GntR family transcriptional regulator